MTVWEIVFSSLNVFFLFGAFVFFALEYKEWKRSNRIKEALLAKGLED